jgi:activator of HSP90 ATPase
MMTDKTNAVTSARIPTRRQMLAGCALLYCGQIVEPTLRAERQHEAMAETTTELSNKMRTSLHQEVDLKANPQRIYGALLSSKDFTAFSGAPAEIDPKVGGAFTLFGGMIVGRNIDLVPNHRIVQAWRPTADFPEGTYSLVKIELKPQGSQTKLVLDHTGFPEGAFDHLNAGWHSHYWEPLKKFLA